MISHPIRIEMLSVIKNQRWTTSRRSTEWKLLPLNDGLIILYE
jgi:hypothetical protein